MDKLAGLSLEQIVFFLGKLNLELAACGLQLERERANIIVAIDHVDAAVRILNGEQKGEQE